MVTYIELSIDQLLLDQDNPRLGEVASQSEALEELVKLNPGQFRKMMLSIVDRKGFDPGDSFYVVKSDDPNEYYVLEGNRRLSALKVLMQPDILDGTGLQESVKKTLVRATTGFSNKLVGHSVRCVLFDSRKDAAVWIFSRHTGVADGEGRKEWGTLEKQRFLGDYSVIDVINFMERNAGYPADVWTSLKAKIESNKSSTLDRLLKSSPGRKYLGIAILKSETEEIPTLAFDATQVVMPLKKIFEDIANSTVDSRSLNDDDAIKSYLETFPAELQPKDTSKTEPRPFRSIEILSVAKAKSTAQPGGPKPTKLSNTPKVRDYLAPRRTEFKTPISAKAQSLLREAASLNVAKFTYSAAYLLRAFIELAVNDYMVSNSLPKAKTGPGSNLNERASAVAIDIVAKGTFTQQEIQSFQKTVVNRLNPASIQSRNGYMHNNWNIPKSEELLQGWDASTPIFIATFGKNA